MAYWLVKSEPQTWSWDQHAKAKADSWTGVRNHQAKAHLMNMKKADRVLFYHSGETKAVVGISEVVRDAYPDPTAKDGAWVCVDLKALAPVTKPVTLAQVKQTEKLSDMVLARNSRLSVQPVTDAEWKLICKLGGVKG